jgi:hypothetical protein
MKKRLIINYIGKKFGRLSILEDGWTSNSGQSMVIAKCECGIVKEYKCA